MIIEWPTHMNAIPIDCAPHRQAYFRSDSTRFILYSFARTLLVIVALLLYVCLLSISFLFECVFFRASVSVCSVRCIALVRKVNARICNNLIVAIWFIIFCSIVMSIVHVLAGLHSLQCGVVVVVVVF